MNTLRRILSSSKHYFVLCKADIIPSSLTRLWKKSCLWNTVCWWISEKKIKHCAINRATTVQWGMEKKKKEKGRKNVSSNCTLLWRLATVIIIYKAWNTYSLKAVVEVTDIMFYQKKASNFSPLSPLLSFPGISQNCRNLHFWSYRKKDFKGYCFTLPSLASLSPQEFN